MLLKPLVKTIIESFRIHDRLDPRSAFFGGRTDACKMYYLCCKILGEKIEYLDFTSLYPEINKYYRYPVGHAEIITQDFEPIEAYFGIAKVVILPPRGLYHPILPYKSQGKNKFPLCQTCADLEYSGVCKHADLEREMHGTWCTPEILKAKEKGYIISEIIEVYHWSETAVFDPDSKEGGLFSEYVNFFLKFKQEASGWPDWCTDDEKKHQYISDYLKNESIALDYDSVCKNPGLRSLSKLCLNSFWGKFGQRDNLMQTTLIYSDEEAKFFQFLTDESKKVKDFHIINEDTIELQWCHNENFITDNANSNLYIACFTTCWARLKLYNVLDSLGERVCYYDTDSVMFITKEGELSPPTGDYLGDLTDELNGAHITELVCGGPKNYGYVTNEGKECVKVRGFTLNYTASQLINFDSMKQLVTTSHEKPIPINNPCKISRDKRKRKIYNVEEKKDYRIVYTKRKVLDNFDTLPYGY